MTSEDGYDVVKAKIPKRGKDGTPITESDLGTGGARRDDGTVAAMVYDVEYLDETDSTTSAGWGPPNDGPDRWSDDDEWSEEAERWAEVVAYLVVEVGIPLAKAAAPHVKSWWTESASPGIRARFRALPDRLRRSDDVADEDESLVDSGQETAVAEVATDNVRDSFVMTQAEWASVFERWQVARSLADALEELLTNATIVEDDAAIEALRNVLRDATPEQKAELANRMMLNPASGSRDDTIRLLSALFDPSDGSSADQELVQLQKSAEVPAVERRS